MYINSFYNTIHNLQKFISYKKTAAHLLVILIFSFYFFYFLFFLLILGSFYSSNVPWIFIAFSY